MQFSFDKNADASVFEISPAEVANSNEISEGIIVDYDQDDCVIGIEILNFTQRHLDLNELIKLNNEEIIPAIVQCELN